MRYEMQIDQENKYKHLKQLVESNVKKLSGFIEIADVSFPQVREDALQAREKAKRANRALHVMILGKTRMAFKKEIWKKMLEYKNLRQNRRQVVINVLDVFRKYQKR